MATTFMMGRWIPSLCCLLQCAALTAAAGQPAAVAVPVKLRLSINGLPLSDRPFLDHTHQWPPQLSWTVHGAAGEVNLRQTAYAVHVDGTRVGERASRAMRHTIPTPARSNAAHDISVAVTLADGRVVRESGSFRTALLRDGFGNASWISGGTLLQRSLADLSANAPSSAVVVNATAYASGVGCFAIRLDGALVSSSFMDPGWATLPTKRVTYRAFDLTPHFTSKSAPKLLRVSLGMCKYGYQGAFCTGAHGANAACKAFLLSLRITYSDGTTRTIDSSATDGAWQTSTTANPIRYAHLYHGEQYDGRVADTPAQWKPATASMFGHGRGGPVAASKALGRPVLLTMPALEVTQRYTPVSVKRVGASSTTQVESRTPNGTFVQCKGNTPQCGEKIFFAETKTKTRHHVHACNMCPGQEDPCQNFEVVAPAAVAALKEGPEFTCSMIGPPKPKTPKWVFDMGDTFAGFATLTLPRSALMANVAVVLKYAEVLKADGSVNMAWCNGEGAACHCSGINCANQTDTFYPAPPAHASDTTVTYTPSFTYHGFRYLQIEGLAETYTPTSADVIGLFVHSAVRQTGNVSFSHPVLDGVQKAIVQTQLSNLHFHPTDCPTREKRGWTGDAQFTSQQASLNLDMRQLYGNWLQTMQDHDEAGCAIDGAAPAFPQTNKDICCNPKHGSFGCDYTGIPNGTFTNTGGSVADVVPFMYVGGWPGDPSWGSISSVLPYTVWKGGDDALVDQFYRGAKRNVDFFMREAADDGLIEFGYYGDWVSIAHTDKPQVTSTAQIMATQHLVEMAAHLGNTADAAAYNASVARMKVAYHTKYWDAQAKSYRGGSQTANLMPLILDIPPPAQRALAKAAFVAEVQKAGNATSSGLVGASFVLQALVLAGRGDIALSMAMREEMPSWGYMVKQGPGTIWETWQDKSNSHNHPMLTASIGPYLYSIAGLDPSTWSVPSYLRRLSAHGGVVATEEEEEVTMHVTPDPHAVRVLGRASGTVATLCGQVAVEWSVVPGEHFEMNADIPHNCGLARLVLHAPDTDVSDLCVGSYRVTAGEADSGALPRNVFRAQMGASNRTVDVVVGGGRSELKLGRCL